MWKIVKWTGTENLLGIGHVNVFYFMKDKKRRSGRSRSDSEDQ